MGKFTIGSVVLVGQKTRPALVLAQVEFNNLILCQITSKPYSSKTAIRIEPSNFINGSLPVISFVRPDKLFTADPSIIKSIAGQLSQKTGKIILQSVRQLFKNP